MTSESFALAVGLASLALKYAEKKVEILTIENGHSSIILCVFFHIFEHSAKC